MSIGSALAGIVVIGIVALAVLVIITGSNAHPQPRLPLPQATLVGGVEERDPIHRFHDDAQHVTCWVLDRSSGISCIPDSQLGGR